MRVHVRDIAARCPACSAEEFEPADGRRFEAASQTRMRCTGCGKITPYVELVMQIADRAIARSSDILAEVKRRRDANQK